ncbi:MAG: hypothetical protein RIQ93_184 [Verrucomicrobiota bacterium]|jgi:outer membrane receptor protein involved in Fe transport
MYYINPISDRLPHDHASRHFYLCLFLLLATLSPAQTRETDALTLAKYDLNKNGRLDPDEITAMEAAQRTLAGTGSAAAAQASVVTLSPFEVRSEDRGYYASNTTSGTRLNSKVEDLASSITVITKEQMTDFAMLDINDVFLYEAGTEGSGTYTDFSVDRNASPVDNTQMNPNNANRVRGVGPANLSFGNFETSGRVPLDPLNIDAIEISRGPNSTVFGIGSAAGTVNMQPASANLSRNRSQVSLRADSYDGYRTSLDVNRVLKKGMLAIRGSGAFQHEGFTRKPSGLDTTRLNGMVKYQPFRYTSVSASFSYYDIKGNRPNTTMPRDAITGWKKAGSPTWDPVTARVTLNGAKLGPFANNALPPYFSNANFATLSTLFIDQKGLGFWSPSRTTSTNTPNSPNQNVFLVNTTPEAIRATQPLFSSDPSVSSRELYEWPSVNLAAVNYMRDTTRTTHLQLEQILFDTPRQMLALQAGYFREDAQRFTRYIMGVPGSSGVTGQLHVDVNERMIDGSANPYFLRPFIGIFGVKGFVDNPLLRETSRVQLAYKLDLRQEKNALRWLGLHQFSGYAEYKDFNSSRTAYRDVLQSKHAWLPTTGVVDALGFPATPAITRGYFRYYVGDNVGANADMAPANFVSDQFYDYRWGNGVTGQFVTERAKLGASIVGNDYALSRTVLKTHGAVLQSHLLQGRVITTFGLRKDRSFNLDGLAPEFTSTDGVIEVKPDSFGKWSPEGWRSREGLTKTAGVVLRPKPWLSVYGNVSDSFQPAGPAMDLFRRPLPDPTGEGTDYGFSLNLMGGRLVTRINKYETKQINSRNGSSTIIAQRLRAIDFLTRGSGSGNVLLYDRASGWVVNAATARGASLTQDQIDTEVAKIMGLDKDYLIPQEYLIGETGDVIAKGTEVEINFTPTNFWTVKLNVTETQSIDSRLSPGMTKWLAERLPVWQRIVDPELGRPWFTERYAGSNSASQFLAASVVAPLGVAIATEGKSRPQIRRYRANMSTSYRLGGLTEQKHLKRMTVGGALRWEDKGAIGYYGVEQLPAVITALDTNRPIYEKANLYADAFVAYRTRLFSNKIGATFQLNVRNLQENGRLQAISAFPDGTPNGYRIIDPRIFILTATFDL